MTISLLSPQKPCLKQENQEKQENEEKIQSLFSIFYKFLTKKTKHFTPMDKLQFYAVWQLLRFLFALDQAGINNHDLLKDFPHPQEYKKEIF